ncbi:MBL fold metallo-hydrolase [Microvirga sp. STS02]|uniref:MBL fold metallo-hydrolase n=1 Tax=Hymenobacter negativus TaxID=2795026 RepID=UPI0018DDDDB2|nr:MULTISPECIES: MBL fold metallo-hydrolase [Bacteria]MBH8568650.1 MBL fold metallo-hydrolase [Hymenobacter negativus]MBR7208384.1 MBL fold metallo-hydrolase [Microvirga sp. STS02]
MKPVASARLQAVRHGKIYQNAVSTSVSPPSGYGVLMKRWLFEKAEREPKKPLGPFPADAAALAAPVPADALRATWLGHSTMLLEIDGRRFLTDPVWSERVSPSQLMGPKRFFAPPLPLDKLPKLDAVILSHDHYDHLDSAAIRVLGRTGVPFFCPLGVGAHLRRWGVPAAHITELNWWETAVLGDDFTLAATPARHFSGRGLTRNDTLWASWCLLGPTHKVFFGGDSGPFDEGFRQIGEAYGPFDLTMLEIGASDPEWADIHMGPDHALEAHQLLGGGPLLPLHWGTFNLAFHAWQQPVQRLLEAAGPEVPLLLPAPGQRVDVAAGPLNSRWWER